MKKIIFILLAILLTINVFIKNKNDNIKIPNSAIRFRVLANSNSPRDQKIKEKVASKMQKELYDLLKNTNDIKDARSVINRNMNTFTNVLDMEMKDKRYSYKIDYGMHYFPEKTYKGVTYEDGMYESLLVTLGKGEGDNWWCVLFPPLCVLEAEETNKSNVEYKSLIKEIISKYF